MLQNAPLHPLLERLAELVDLLEAEVLHRRSHKCVAVKHQPSLQHIPLVFYCSANSTFARSVRGGLKIAAESVGVDLYITMEKFDGELFAE